jgi:hypothetical protein
LRELGPNWVLQRLRLAAEVHFGIVRKRLPLSAWKFEPSNLVDPTSGGDRKKTKEAIKGRFFFSGSTLPAPPAESSACEQADRILSGEWPFFLSRWVQLGFPPDWHFNTLDGRRVEDTRHWSEIDIGAIHDVKFVWEPNRFSVTYLLARAYARARDERYAEAFWNLVEDWANRNPPNRGVNWASGQEAALRVMAWSFGLHAFSSSPSSTEERTSKLLWIIEVHGNRISAFIQYALSQRNNHGIGEAVGLFTIGILFPEFRRADEWMELGRKLIESQILEQVYEDGSYIQHSFNYQRGLIDYLVWAFRLGEVNDHRFSEECYQILSRAVQFMLRFCDLATGRMPNYGANDGSLVLPLSPCDYLDYRPSLQAAHYMVHRKFCFETGNWDEQSQWLFGTELTQRLEGKRRPPRIDVETKQPESGYLKLVARESHAMLRAARYEDRPSQADQLHLDLWWRGQNIACDPGTYLYNAPSPWTNGLAGTAVHNTITVGRRDQMTRAGRFLWLDWAQADSLKYEIGDSCRAIEAWHDGYEKLGATHRRCVAVISDEDCWIVVDDVCGDFRGDIRLHWLFEDCRHGWRSSDLRLTLQTAVGDFQCCVHATKLNTPTLVIGGRVSSDPDSSIPRSDYQIRGWRSLYYGQKDPAISLAVETQEPLPVRFVTVLAPSAVSVIKVDETVVEVGSNGERYRVCLRPAGSGRIAESPS